MMSLAELGRRLRYLLRRDAHTAELEEEIRLHLELRAERLQQRGATAGDARLGARRRFGNPTSIQERSRDMWSMEWLEHAAGDVRFAIRRLRSRPGFSLSAITVAALGIGATTAVFSAVDAAMLRPLPFSSPAELVALPGVKIPFDEEEGERDGVVSIEHVRALTDFFSSAAAFAAGGLNLEDPDRPQRLRAGVVTDNFFSTLGVHPLRGRLFTREEGRPKGPRAVIISHALWRSYFNSADIGGRTLALSGDRYAVVGVMPPSFRFPSQSDVWIPLSVPTTPESFAPFRGYLPSRVIARVAPGVSIEAASRRLVARWEQEVGSLTASQRANVEDMLDDIRDAAALSLQREIVGDQRKALTILMSATVLLLLIAAANVANLLLSDGASRRREVALREVLGASRSRITRQLLVESIVLALAGALVGLAIAPAALGVLRAMMPSDLAGTAPVHVDLRVLTFATGLALGTGVLFGLWPALGTAGIDAAETIKSGGGYGATSGTLGRARRLLITAEFALTVVLLVGSGLMLKSFHRLMTQDFGMNPARAGTLELTFAGATAAEVALSGELVAERARRIQTMIDRLAADPSIEAVGVVNDLPLRGGGGLSALIEADGVPAPEGARFPRYLIASGGYFKAMGIPLLRGRTFLATDDTIGPRAAIISNEMAKVYWPNLDPIGRTFHMSRDSVRYTVVGIVADVRERSLDRAAGPQMYFSAYESVPKNLALIARSRVSGAALLSRLTDAVRFASPQQAVFNVRMMDDVVGASVAPRQTNTTLIVLFGAAALVLSAFGVYAVVSYGVARRTREFGIRSALGANGADIVTLVGREMISVVAVGLSLGLVLAWALVRTISSLLFEVPAHDLQIFGVVPLVLLLPAAVATLVPALRAMRVSPTEVMRAE